MKAGTMVVQPGVVNRWLYTEDPTGRSRTYVITNSQFNAGDMGVVLGRDGHYVKLLTSRGTTGWAYLSWLQVVA